MKLTDGTADSSTVIASGGGVEAAALRVTVASDSTGVLSVDDNGGSLTVDGTVTADTELTTADLDTGAGTDTRAVVGLARAESGGAVLVGSANPLPVNDAGGSLTVDGSVSLAAAVPAGTNNIGDVDVLTVPADPFGANADAAATAGSTGSIQAKLRLMTSQLDAIQTAVQTLDNAIAGSEMQVDVVGALPAGNNNVGDVDVASIAAGTNAIGNVGVVPRTTGGLTIFRSLDLDETEEEIKATAGQLFGWYIYNDGAAEAYVKLYNATTANVTVGSTTPVMTIPIPAGSAANVFSEIGIAFGTAITAAATTAVADADTTAPAANQVVANFLYS